MPKMCIPARPVLHFRLPKDGIPKSVYPDMDGFFDDLGQTYKKAVQAFYDAGCRCCSSTIRCGRICARPTR